ncbi:MAG TPA: hypothetical protein VNG12_11105, partial [Acidimicrobiales bacterium]|nr:hypothetical protein [Acidimicrobiales bacterium]
MAATLRLEDAMSDFYAPDLQTMPRAERAVLQDQRLAELSQRAHDLPIPFIKRRLEAARIGPGELSTANLGSVETVTKDDVRESERLAPPFGDYRGASQSEWIRLAATTGSTGRPTYVVWTKRDLAAEADAYARNQWRQGFRPGATTVVTAHPGYLNGGEALTRTCAESFGALCLSIGPPTDDAEVARALEVLQLLKPNRYVLLGPAHLRLYEMAVKAGLDPEADLNMPPPDDNVAFQWRQVSAGMDAFAFLGTECHVHAGAHVNEDYAIVESLTPDTKEPVGPGERGNLVVTTIGRDNVVVRYDTEDVVRILPDPCPCGETTRKMYFDGRR